MISNQSINFANYLKKAIPSILFTLYEKELTIYVNSVDLLKVMFFLKKHTTSKIEQLIDITAIDYPQRKLRFEILYQFLSVTYNQRFTVVVFVNEANRVDSRTSLYSSSG
jgi:NADH:ubiquinone oxidoreductase subunit C